MFLSVKLSSFLFVALIASSLIGLGLLTDYSSRPGPSTNVLTSLPKDFSQGEWVSDEATTIFFFYHPKCPCSYASIRCLERLVPRFDPNARIFAFAYLPESQPDSWVRSPATDILERLNIDQVHRDINGKISRQFGVAVSGHVLVFARNKQLIFSGGITPFRGHEGGCQASAQLVRSVNGDAGKLTHWPVFGCAINQIANR